MKSYIIFILPLLYTIDISWCWRTIDDIEDRITRPSNDNWKWEDLKATENQNDEIFPEKLQPLPNKDWTWESSTNDYNENDLNHLNENKILNSYSHRKKKQYSGDDYINENKKGLPRISTELYKAILGESKSFQEVVNSILNPKRILEDYYTIFSDKEFQQNIQRGDLNEAKVIIENKLCELGLMKCIQQNEQNYNRNRDLYRNSKPFVFESTKSKREIKKYPETRQNSRLTVNNYGYGQNENLGNVGNLASLGNLANLGALGNLPQTFASLSQKAIAPTFGFSFGLPIPTAAYPFNVIGGGVPPVSPYLGALSPNGVKLGLINVNPLVSVQYAKDEYGDKVIKPLVHLHITPNENILNKLGGYLKAKKQEALHNYHHHYHEHEYPPIIPSIPYPPTPPILPSHPPIAPPHPPFHYDHVPQTPFHYDHIPQTPYFKIEQQQQHHNYQPTQHQHHHYYDDFNSKFIYSGDSAAIQNYQYGFTYPYTKDNTVVKNHISDIAPISYTSIGNTVSSGNNNYNPYQTVENSGYITGYPTGYEDYYGITSKSQRNRLGVESNSKLKFPESRSIHNGNELNGKLINLSDYGNSFKKRGLSKVRTK